MKSNVFTCEIAITKWLLMSPVELKHKKRESKEEMSAESQALEHTLRAPGRAEAGYVGLELGDSPWTIICLPAHW